MNSPTPRTRLAAAIDLFTASDRVIAALAIFLCLYYVGTRGIYQGKASGDGFFGFMYLPSLFYHHSLDIGPTVPQWVPYLGREPTGHVPNACPIGPTFFWIPTYALALGLEKLTSLFVRLPAQPLPGQTVFHFWMAGLGSLFAGLVGIASMFRLLRRKLGVGPARVGTVVAVLATPIAWYIVTQPLYQHACAFFAVTLLVERWDAWRGDERGLTPARMAILGTIGGMGMMMRIQEAIWLLLPGLDALSSLIAALRGGQARGSGAEVKHGPDLAAAGAHLVGGLLLALCALIAFAPQLLLWHWLFGHIRTPQPAGHMRWADPAIIASLFSIRGGLLPWSPVLYLLVPGLIAGRRSLGGLAWRFGLLMAIELWVNASAWDHWGSWTFGARRYSDATVVFGAALAGLWWWASEVGAERARRVRRAVVGALFALAVLEGVFVMEMVRQQRVKSSGAGAYPFSVWVTWAKGPTWLAHLFDRTGFPFVQPAGWIYSLVYHVPPRTFEGVVGSYFLERDSRIHAVVQHADLVFADPGSYVPEGIAGAPDAHGMVPVAGRVRVLVPIFAREAIRIHVRGAFDGKEAAARASWNGQPLSTRALAADIVLEVPERLVHTRADTNQLVLELPSGARLLRLDFESLGNWWR